MKPALWFAAFCCLISACTSAEKVDGPSFLDVLDWSGCTGFHGASDYMPRTVEDSDFAFDLATDIGEALAVDREVAGVRKVSRDVWAILGSDGLVIGAMEVGQNIAFCND